MKLFLRSFSLILILLGVSQIAQVTLAADSISVTKHKCTITGTNKSETLKGTSREDVICGLGGNDVIYGFAGNDIIDAGSGNDKVFGGAGNDQIYGGTGTDYMDGGSGFNLCVRDKTELANSSCKYLAKLPIWNPSPANTPSNSPSPTSTTSPSASPTPISSPSGSSSPAAPGGGGNGGSQDPAPTPSPSAGPAASSSATFEIASANVTLTGFLGDSATLAVAPSPSVSGSTKSVRIDRTSSSGSAGAVFFTHDSSLIAADSKILTLSFYAPQANQPVLLKLEDPANASRSIETLATTQSVGWQTLNFDFANPRTGTNPFSAGISYRKVVIFYAFGLSTQALTYYVDNLSLNASAGSNTPVTPVYVKGAMLWSDEFDGSGQPDSAKWSLRNCGQTAANGGGSCYNNEQQAYSADAISLDGAGNAIITTNKLITPISGSRCMAWSGNCYFSSGRFDTQGKIKFKYGVIEARIQNPTGGANWPAFWMLGENITSIGWPQSGEIDVMEGKSSTMVSSAIHWSNGGQDAFDWVHYSASNFSTGFHTYSLYWLENYIAIYVDGNKILEETPSSLSQPGTWAFNDFFFLILNNAVGPDGGFGGTYDGWTSSQMKIDYVRYYQLNGIGTLG